MARIAFILLCHKDPQGVIAQARRLTAAGDYVSIHFDGRASDADFQIIHSALSDDPSVTFAPYRHKCGWGEWSLVAATLGAVRAAHCAFAQATHFYMLSGDCMPVKSARYAHDFLDAEDVDYIEHVDFFDSDWIKTGLKGERLFYRHWFNERTQKRRFYASLEVQKRLGLARRVPDDLRVMIGSQWWCLRRQTIEKVLSFTEERPDVMRFFAATWIPDETFFQTIVPHVVARREIRSRTLTFLMFTDYGMPVTFYNDHYDLLLRQDFIFARKVSPEAKALKEQLGLLWQDRDAVFPISNEGPGLYRFLAGRGRIGRRFAPRFWETEGSLARSSTLLILVAKKWHVAKRLAARVRAMTSIAATEYLFNEQDAALPDLGGAGKSLAKRHRHRKALIRLLFDQFETDKMVICLDPSALDMILDLAADKAATRVMLIETGFDDAYLRGHVGRVGLAGPQTPPDVLDRLLPVVRQDLEHEHERLRDLSLESFFSIAPGAPAGENAHALAQFLGIAQDQAAEFSTTRSYSPTESAMPYAYDDSNIFARILRGEIPNDTVVETEHTLAFRDIRPALPVHVLVIPKGRYVTFDDFAANASSEEITDFMRVVAQVTEKEGVSTGSGGNGFRAISNAGPDGVQEVPHFHLHILGGQVVGRMLSR